MSHLLPVAMARSRKLQPDPCAPPNLRRCFPLLHGMALAAGDTIYNVQVKTLARNYVAILQGDSGKEEIA